MGGDAGDMLKQVAGYGVGALGALTSLKGGGLQNYFINRQRMLEDPAFRATLVDSPFTAGVFGVGHGEAPSAGGMPAAGGAAAPGDVRYLPAGGHWYPALAPLAYQQQAKEEQDRATMVGLTSNDPAIRTQSKLAIGVPLTNEEMSQAVGAGRSIVAQAGPGSQVQYKLPGGAIQIGSPYNFASIGAEEYPTYEAAAAAASQRPGWTVIPSGRGTFLLAPPPTREQLLPTQPPPPATSGAMPGNVPAPVMRGGTPPAPSVPVPGPGATAGPPLFAGAVTTTGGPPNTVPTRTNNPGDIMDGPFARSQPGYVGPGPEKGDGGRIAVFDSPESGYNAMNRLLDKPRYQGQTVGGAVSTWTAGGHDPAFVRREIGLDPDRTVASLTPEEKATLVRGIAHGEGYGGPQYGGAPARSAPAVQPAPAPAPAPAPRVAPTVAATSAPTFDPNATVPHVVVPAPAAPGATVGYPPAAPEPPAGTITPTTIPALRSPGAPVAAIPGAPAPAAELPGIPVDPNTGLPLAGRTYESQTGSATYSAPPRGDPRTQMLLRYNGIADPAQTDPAKIVNYFATDQALKNNESMDKAAIERTQRGMTEGESAEFKRLIEMKTAYNEFIKQYPDAEARAKFLGFVDAPIQTLRARLGWQDAQAIRDFRNGFGPFALESLTDEKGKPQPGMEWVGGMAPSVHDSAGEFESNLQHFGDALDRRLTIVSNLRAMPVGAASPALVDSWVDQLQHQSLANRLGVFQPPPPAVAPTAPPPVANAAPPPAATAPPWQPNWVQ